MGEQLEFCEIAFQNAKFMTPQDLRKVHFYDEFPSPEGEFHFMAKLGAAGWELVSVSSVNGRNDRYYLKRKINQVSIDENS